MDMIPSINMGTEIDGMATKLQRYKYGVNKVNRPARKIQKPFRGVNSFSKYRIFSVIIFITWPFNRV
jgi:hypothetical protein